MVALPEQKDVSDLNIGGSPQPLLPPGDYKAVAVESEFKDTSSGNGKFLQIKFVITDGQYANTEFFERLNLINPNQQAVDIAYNTLGKISNALGFAKTPADSTEIHNKPLLISLKTEEGKPWKDKDGNEREGKDKSVIGGYKPVGAVTTQAAAPVLAPQQVQAQADLQTQTAQAPQTPPWAS